MQLTQHMTKTEAIKYSLELRSKFQTLPSRSFNFDTIEVNKFDEFKMWSFPITFESR